MSGTFTRLPAAIALLGAVLGLVFSTYSTVDYAAHLDRRLHDVHCSVIPGAPPKAEAEGCRAAMYSPYGSVLKDTFWGGLPVALPAQGSFAFFLGFALYLLLAGPRASKAATIFFAVVGVTPLLVSVVMFIIAVTQLGTICQTCLGIYIASLLVAVGAVLGLLGLRRRAPTDEERPRGNLLLPAVWLAVLGTLTLLPAGVYAASVPDERPYFTGCGKLAKPDAKPGVLVHMAGPRAVKPAVIFEDPLCATCKGVHQRLVQEGILDRLNVQLVLFPLDSECNWMLDQALHPGACLVSRAVLCSGDQAAQMLNWAYDEQEYLTRAGKAGAASLREVIRKRWGDGIARCLDDKQTGLRLNEHLHFASNNGVPVSTPQIYLSNQRLCDEDTDLGLRYTLRQVAPEVLP
jgi:uncharacterized membrane protein